jgi:predicted transcriptional regulator
MEALIELMSDETLNVILKRFNDQGLPMILSAVRVPVNDILEMGIYAREQKNELIPVTFNQAEDEDDFWSTLEARGLNSNLKVTLITNIEGYYFELGNEVLKAGVTYGPIRFETLDKIIDLDWPVEVYLPFYSESSLEDEDVEIEYIKDDEEELRGKFKSMSREEQEELMKSLEEQEKRGEI